MSRQPTVFTAETPAPDAARNAGWVALFSAAISTVALLASVYELIVGDPTRGALTTLLTALLLGASTLAWWFSRQRQPVLAVLVQTISLGLFMTAMTLTLEDFSASLLLPVTLAVMIALVFVLPSALLSRAIPLTVLAATAILALDLVWGLPRYPTSSQLVLFFQVATVGFAIVGGVLIASRFNRYPLRVKLLLLFLVVALAPLATVTFISTQSTGRLVNNSAIAAMGAVSEQTATEIDTFNRVQVEVLLNGTQSAILSSFLQLPADQRAGSPFAFQVDEQLRRIHERTRGVLSTVAIVDANGDVAGVFRLQGSPVRQGLDNGANVADQVYFTAAQSLPAGEMYISPVLFTRVPADPTIYYTMAYIDRFTGVYGGALVVQYDAELLQQLLRESVDSVNPPAGSYPVLIDENGLVLAHTVRPLQRYVLYAAEQGVPADQFALWREQGRVPNLAGSELFVDAFDLRAGLGAAAGSAEFVSADPLVSPALNQVVTTPLAAPSGWQLLYFQPLNAIQTPIASLVRTNVLVATLLVAAIVAVTLLALPLVTAPLARLNTFLVQLGQGDLEARASTEVTDEIGAVARSANRAAEYLQAVVTGLETEVTKRTQQLITVAQVARTISQVRDPEQLMADAVEAIKRDFDLYYAGIFLLNETGDTAVLHAGSGEAGRAMLARNHRLDVGGRSMIGQAISTTEPRIAFNVEQERIRFRNPDLPLTRTELALPLVVAGVTLGALSIQSTQANAFDDADITTFQGLADQLAVAINNAHLFAAQAENLAQINLLNQALMGGSWRLAGEQTTFVFDGGRLIAAGDAAMPANVQAVATSRQLQFGASAPNRAPSVTLPLQVRGEVVGAFEIVPAPGKTEWTADELATLEQILVQTGYALENALLIDQVQRALNASRAAADRERTLRQVTGEIRENVEVDTILATTLRRLGEILGAQVGEVSFERQQVELPRLPNRPANGATQPD